MRKMQAYFLTAVLLSASACAGRATAPSTAAAPAAKSFNAYLSQGIADMERGDYRQATDNLRTAVKMAPDSSKAHNYLGLCYFRQRGYDPAKEEFQRAAALDPSNATAYNNLAGVLSIKQDFAGAENMYRKALGLAPDLVSANYSLGVLLANLGKTEEGIGYLSRGIALDPQYLETHMDMVTMSSSVAFDMKETYFTYAKAYASAGEVDKAVEYLAKAREAGFFDWPRILKEREFEKVRADPRIKEFLKAPAGPIV